MVTSCTSVPKQLSARVLAGDSKSFNPLWSIVKFNVYMTFMFMHNNKYLRMCIYKYIYINKDTNTKTMYKYVKNTQQMHTPLQITCYLKRKNKK